MEDEMLTPVMMAAAQLHELFAAYVAAGFTRAEALEIVIRVMVQQRPA